MWPTHPQEVETQLKKYFHVGGEHEVNDDLTVSVTGNVRFKTSQQDVTRLAVRFRRVSGDFIVRFNQIESLDGFPLEVGGSCNIDSTEVTSLEHAPNKVMGTFECSSNAITSLHYGPETVGKNYLCNNCQLTSPKGAPQVVPGLFDISHNPLTSLQGLPIKVGSLKITYSPQLPLLALMLVRIDDGTINLEKAPVTVRTIISKHVNSGRKGAVEAQRELMDAGLNDNAKF